MFDIGMMELLTIGIVALIVVGPKDLPRMFRTLGQVTGKIRMMAREFQRSMNDAAGDTGMGDIAKDLRKMTNPKSMGMDALKEATSSFDKWVPEDGEMDSETAKLAKKRALEAHDAAEAAKEALAKRAARKTAVDQGADVPDGPAPAPATGPAPAEATPETAAAPAMVDDPGAVADDPDPAPAVRSGTRDT